MSTPRPQASDDSYLLCHAINETGDAECVVRELAKDISVYMNTNRPEASKICGGIIRITKSKTKRLGGWKMKIYSTNNRTYLLASRSF